MPPRLPLAATQVGHMAEAELAKCHKLPQCTSGINSAGEGLAALHQRALRDNLAQPVL